jgi:serine phosphatase RsbU (regulator of sigma subunit)
MGGTANQGVGGTVAVTRETRGIGKLEARLESLQVVSAELARAATPDEVVEVIARGTADAFGGVSSALCLLSDDGEHFELVRETGFAEGVVDDWHRFPVAAPLPAGDAVRTGEPVVLTSIAERDARYPTLRDIPTESRSFIALPLIVGDETTLGVLNIGFPEERTFDGGDRGFFQSLAALCAQALHRAALLEVAQETAEQQRFIASAAGELASSLDYDETLHRVVRLAVPRIADLCAVLVVGAGGPETAERIVFAHVDVEAESELRSLGPEIVPLGARGGIGAALLTGEVEWYPVIDDEVLQKAAPTPEGVELLRSLGFGAAGVLPLVARGRAFGVLVFGNKIGRPFTPQDMALAEELTSRAAVSIENARLFTDRVAVAQTLQASLLPPRPPEVPEMDVATRFHAGAHDVSVGGDFYDVFRLGVNDWGLAIGDVCGKGAEAATLTALVRYTLRAAAVHNRQPTDVLAEVNRAVLAEGTGERFCSAVFARLELDRCGAWVTMCSAGHPRPVVVRRAGWVDVRAHPGMLLGLYPESDLGLMEDTVGLGPGDAIVFCTDGITEARSADGEQFGEDRLLDVLLASAVAGDSASALADRVLDTAVAFASAGIQDDVAVLVVRVPPDALDDPDARLRTATGLADGLDLPADPHANAAIRPAPPREARMALPAAIDPGSFVAGVLRSWRMDPDPTLEARARELASADGGSAALVVRWTGAPATVTTE